MQHHSKCRKPRSARRSLKITAKSLERAEKSRPGRAARSGSDFYLLLFWDAWDAETRGTLGTPRDGELNPLFSVQEFPPCPKLTTFWDSLGHFRDRLGTCDS